MKCNNCGSEIAITNSHIAKCSHCGKIYSVKEKGLYQEVSDIEGLYQEALKLSGSNKIIDMELAIDYFDLLDDYKDCRRRKEKAVSDKEKELANQRRLEEEEKQKIINKKNSEKKKKKRAIGIIIAASCMVFVAVSVSIIVIAVASIRIGINKKRESIYLKAIDYYSNEDYVGALTELKKIKNYKNSGSMIIKIEEEIDLLDEQYNQGIEYYNRGDYYSALDSFLMCVNYSNSKEYIEKVYLELVEQAAEFVAEEKLDEANQILDSIPNESVSFSKVLDLKNQIEIIKEEKRSEKIQESCTEAENLKNQKKYSEALTKMNESEEMFGYDERIMSCINDIKKSGIDQYCLEADELLSKEEFTEALVKLDTAENLFGNDSEISQKIKEIKKKKWFNDLNEAEKNDDIVEAMKIVNNCEGIISTDEEIVEKSKIIQQQFVENALSETDIILHSEGIDAAILRINDAIGIFPSERLTSKKAEINNLKPLLFDFTNVFGKDNALRNIEKSDETGTDVNAEDVYNVYRVDWSEDYDSTVISYRMTGEYDKISGYLYVSYSRRQQVDGKYKESNVIVIADGNPIGTIKADNTQGAQFFSFNISDVSLLEFKCSSDCKWSDGNYWGAPTYKYILFSEVYLEKNY